MIHVPADRQVALLQLGRQRGQRRQLAGHIREDKRQRGIGAACRQGAAQLVELQDDRPRRDGMDRSHDQPVHLGQPARIDRLIPAAIVKIGEMAQVALILVKRTQQRIALQMAALAALQHLRHALLQRVAAANNIGHPRLLLLRQRGRRQLGQRVLQRLLRRQQPFRFAFVLQRPHHLRQAHRRRGDIRRVPRQIHTAAHIVEGLALHLLLQLAGVVKAEHRHAAHQQGDDHHQQIKGEQAATGAGEKRVSASGHSNSGEGTVGR